MKYTAIVEGMMCAMCEKNMSKAITEAFNATDVKADHSTNTVEFNTEAAVDEELLKNVTETAGFEFKGIR